MIDNIGYPVIVYDQVGNSFQIFVGLVLRRESAFCLGDDRYRGRISVIRVVSVQGQNEGVEIHHGIHHFSERNSASSWVYPDEIETMYHDFDDTYNQSENQKKILEICERMAIKNALQK